MNTLAFNQVVNGMKNHRESSKFATYTWKKRKVIKYKSRWKTRHKIQIPHHRIHFNDSPKLVRSFVRLTDKLLNICFIFIFWGFMFSWKRIEILCQQANADIFLFLISNFHELDVMNPSSLALPFVIVVVLALVLCTLTRVEYLQTWEFAKSYISFVFNVGLYIKQ